MIKLDFRARTPVLTQIQHYCKSSPENETGGILMGFQTANGIEVVAASDAGPNATANPGHFVRDTAHCAQILAKEFAVSGADYIGEWHSHLATPAHPSAGDLLTLARIMLDPDYNFGYFGMILAILTPSGSVRLQGYLASRPSQDRREYPH